MVLCNPVAMSASDKLGVPRIIPAKDMADKKVDHLGPMALAAWHRIAGKF